MPAPTRNAFWRGSLPSQQFALRVSGAAVALLSAEDMVGESTPHAQRRVFPTDPLCAGRHLQGCRWGAPESCVRIRAPLSSVSPIGRSPLTAPADQREPEPPFLRLRADARSIPLPAQSMDLIVTSPPWLCHGGSAAGDCRPVDECGWMIYLGTVPIVLAPEPSLPCPTNLSSTAASTSPLK